MAIHKMPTLHTPLTEELAKEHASLPQIDGDRKFRPARMTKLKDLFDQGLFYDPEWAIAYLDGTKYRINGKHSSHLLISMNGKFPKGMFVTIKQFKCDTPLELATLFEQFDSRISVRTNDECNGVHKSVHPELADLSNSIVSFAVRGVAWVIREESGESLTEDQQRQIIHEHSEFIRWCCPLVGTRRMKKTGVIAAMFKTWSVDSDVATSFWTHVRDQSHEDKENATRRLGKFLELCIYDPLDKSTKQRWDVRALYSKGIHAWNAFRQSRGTDLKYHPSSPLPQPK